ncbi:hypothetical protein Tco_1060281, partial [Tanacetum coccineum]
MTATVDRENLYIAPEIYKDELDRVGIRARLVSWMVTDLEDSKTHTVGGVWSGEYMDHGFTKSMTELDRCYTMLQELRSVIVGGALIHKNREGSKHEGQRIRPTIGDFRGNCASNQSSFNNGRIKEWEEEKKEDRVPTNKVNGKYDVKRNLYLFSWEGRRIAMVPPKVTPQLPKPEVKGEKKIVKAEVVEDHIEKIQDLQSYKQHDDNISTLSFGTMNKVDTLKTCEEIKGFNDDEDVKVSLIRSTHPDIFGSWIDPWEYGRRVKKYEGFRVDVKSKSIKDKVVV